jgi:hypothetical protein
MAAAAYTLPVDRQSDWLVELERILDGWDTLSGAAREAVFAVVESLLGEPGCVPAEYFAAHELFAHGGRGRLLTG